MDGLTQYLTADEERPKSHFYLLVCLHGIGIFLLTCICVVVFVGLSDLNGLIQDAHIELQDLSALIPKAE